MSIVDTNWVVPSGNPINTPPGVASIAAGSGITVTGTDINPIVSATSGAGAVQSVDGLIGALSITGGAGMTVTTNGQEIILDAAVTALVAGNGCSISEFPPGSRIYTITNTAALTAGTMTSYTQQLNVPDGTSVEGGGVPLNVGYVQPVPGGVDAGKNGSIFLELTMCGDGRKVGQQSTSNQISCGVYIDRGGGNVQLVTGYVGPLQRQIDVNWGNNIPNLNNQGVIPNLLRAAVTWEDYSSGNLFFGYFAAFPLLDGVPYYEFTNLKYNLNTIYIA
jgi:hypothetical protein